jgi:hypothetical protein
MASGTGAGLPAERSRVILKSQPGFRRCRQGKDALYRETLQTPGRTTRILKRPKRVCVDHQSVNSVTRAGARRERAHYPSSRGSLILAFLRHGGIYRSDVVSKPRSKPGAGVPPPVGRHPVPVQGRDGRRAPYPSSAMSSGLLFLDRVARQQSPSPLHRHPQINTHSPDAQAKGTFLLCPKGTLSLCCHIASRLSLYRPTRSRRPLAHATVY